MTVRILVAKPGLDGHDRGARSIALALRQAGFEVIYTGLRNTPRQIALAAVQEDVGIVGLSILAGGHLGLTEKVLKELNELGATNTRVVVGGVIPREDIEELIRLGAAAVFPSGMPVSDVVAAVSDLAESIAAS
jgi:methylmalonyl-CoA mutase C-terminal domain/subunit